MPRSCSCSIQSIVAVPSCTSPILCVFAGIIQNPLGRSRLARINMGHNAEVSVILDRMTARHVSIPSTARTASSVLPAIMRECPVGFRHPMGIFTLLDGIAAVVGGIHQFGGQPSPP